MYSATGRRKTSVARVILKPGSGVVVVNGMPVEQYFHYPAWRSALVQPLQLTETIGQYDVRINVFGGGVVGQAQAVRHGIARALLSAIPTSRPALKAAGLLTRDSREKERKKYGQKGARKRFQYSKR